MRISRVIAALLVLATAACGKTGTNLFPDAGGLGAERRADAKARGERDVGETAKLRILETTDLHVNMEAFDYYKNTPVTDIGFVRAATVVRRARAEVTNSMLFDNGDLLQGSPLGDWFHKDRDPKTDLHTVFKAMNLLGYDAANIGNHDFNYGLDFLEESLQGAKFPYVNANVLKDDGGKGQAQQQFNPYIILTKEVVTDSGKKEIIKVGVIGFTPPQIMNWDKVNLTGKVTAPDMVDVAKEFVPRMKAEGADIIVAIPHSGISAAPRAGGEENAVYYLADVPGIDVILSGHSHQVFPSDTYKDIPNADLSKGTIKGVPTVMAGFWGSHVGVVDLNIKLTASGWVVTDGTGATRQVKTTLAATDFEADIRAAIADDHKATLDYLQTAVGQTESPIDTYFSIAVPSLGVQIVADAQVWYAQQLIAQGGSAAALAGLPILSASAPLNAGQTPTAFTDVPTGQLTLRNLADMYVYPNTAEIVKLTGAQVQEWLEMAAQIFTQIKPNTATEQPLVTGRFPEYNFDEIQGVTYSIDVSQASRYDKSGKIVNPNSHRIVGLSYNGQPIDPAASFLVVTNNYRAFGGGNFPGLNGSAVVLDPSYESRQALRDYAVATGTVGGAVTQTWKLIPVPGATNVTFESGPAGKTHLGETGGVVSVVGDQADGFTKYKLNWN